MSDGRVGRREVGSWIYASPGRSIAVGGGETAPEPSHAFLRIPPPVQARQDSHTSLVENVVDRKSEVSAGLREGHVLR